MYVEGENAASGRDDGAQIEEGKDTVCLNNDLCAGIVFGMISNLGQAASPIHTDAPVPISTPSHSLHLKPSLPLLIMHLPSK